ncbi:MAG: putative protein family [Clostridia bacterium]|jgi:uncharacterized integral membrane protein (TIGR00698 family)|nr:putative protein family [Clostridia bacterium]
MHNLIFKKIIPGILLVLAIAIPAWYLGKLFPIMGGPVFGILIGILVAFWKRPDLFNDGIKFTSKKLLQTAIILLGFEMNLYNVIKVGSQSLVVMLFTLTAAFMTAYLVGRALKLQGNVAILIGVGTAICGGSAIAATAPVIKAEDKEIAYSISTIFLFNVAAVFIFPAIGHLVQMSDIGFGIWAGTAINDTSSVVAAGYSYSDAAGSLATIVKLTRTLMIIPITLFLAIYTHKKTAQNTNFALSKVFPWFVLGFVAASIISTTGLVSLETGKLLAQFGKFLIVMAMAAIGLNTNIKQLISNGIKPILLGLCCWIAVALTSIIAQYMLKLW